MTAGSGTGLHRAQRCAGRSGRVGFLGNV